MAEVLRRFTEVQAQYDINIQLTSSNRTLNLFQRMDQSKCELSFAVFGASPGLGRIQGIRCGGMHEWVGVYSSWLAWSTLMCSFETASGQSNSTKCPLDPLDPWKKTIQKVV